MAKNETGIYLNHYATVVGPLEKKSHLEKLELCMDDYYFGEKSFEQAEIKMQKTALDQLLAKAELKSEDLSLLISGDLSDQIGVSSIAAVASQIPFLGVYNACATFVESLILACMYLKNHSKNKVICMTSSHNLHAEKQFRFPIEYGAPKKKTSTFTTTGAVATLISKEKSRFKLGNYTIGKAIDMGLNDTSNMGAIMAPAAAQTIYRHLQDNKMSPKDYDIILTGDLGEVGSKLLKEYFKTTYQIDLKNHVDAGSDIYLEKDKEKVLSGGSGPSALPIYLFHKVLKNKKNKKILLVATGSLHNPLFVNQKQTIPAIAHAIELEVIS
ncbi:MAG: stage V sporulation protein AD [Bacilli bacterium]|nr:stage V sporulation protein AD [Bacilli bacterium]